MPRQSRKKSSTGIYHVMLRGINKQDIFEEEEDYVRMKEILNRLNEVLTGTVPVSHGHARIYVETNGNRGMATHHYLPGGKDSNQRLVDYSIRARKETIKNMQR